MQTKTCERCKKEFEPRKSGQRFCCRICADTRHWESLKSLKPRLCENCWKQFQPKNYKRRYCCKECADEWKKKRKDCEYCGKKFRSHKGDSKYCSQECYHKSDNHRFYIPWQHGSKENKHLEKTLNMLWFNVEREFHLWKYYFDFKIWDTLIELNPYPFHNCTWSPIGKVTMTKNYHYNKYQYATQKWYKCIMVRDWTTNLIEMITDKQFRYKWLPQLHYYNPKTKGHIIRKNRNKSRVDKWFVEIRDCGKETF